MKAIRILLSTALVAVVATSAFAFMATNRVDTSYAGEGGGAVLGFHVSDISYVISPTDPSHVVGVSFNLDPADANTVMIKVAKGPDGPLPTPISGMCGRIDHTARWACLSFSPWGFINVQDLHELEVMAAK